MALLFAAGALVILGIIAAASLRDVLAARGRLVAARDTLAQTAASTASLATAGGRATAGHQVDAAIDQVTVAGTIVHGSFPLRLARFVPFLSTQRSGLVRLIDDSQSALGATRTLLTNVETLAATGRVAGARVPLGALASFETDIRAAGSALAGLDHPASGLVGPLGRARRSFDALAGSTSSRLLRDADALKVAQSLLGAGGPRRYFVALENDAEMRDQGAVTSFAAVTFDHGQIHVDQHGSVNAALPIAGTSTKASLALKRPADIAIPPGTATVFGSTLPTLFWANVDATADFGFTGRAIQAMYRQATGVGVDGVFALDVPALSSLLTVVGPVTVPGIGQPLTAENAAPILLHDLYEAFPPGQQVARQELLSDVAAAVIDRLSTTTFDPVPLAERLAGATAGGHLRAWSADHGEEQILERNGLGGGPAATSPEKAFHMAVENRNATKMDYYIRTATEQQIRITPAGTAIVTTTIDVHNTAPASITPSYAAGPDGNGMTQAGEYWAWALLWGPAGSSQPGAVEESGLNLSQTVLARINPGQSKQAKFVTVIPHAVHQGRFELRFVPQPRLVTPTLRVTVKSEKWKIDGPATWNGPWDRTLNLGWNLHR